MTEKDFKAIFSRGSARKRALLMANHLAQSRLTGKRLLTHKEFRALDDSFKSEDLWIYNKTKRVHEILEKLFPSLDHLISKHFQVLTAIEMVVREYHHYQRQEELLNSLLELVRVKDRPAALRMIADYGFPLADFSASEDECWVTIDTDKKVTKAKVPNALTLFDLLDITHKRAREILRTAKTIIQYGRDVMEHNDVDIKPFRKRLELIEKYFKTDKPLPLIKEEFISEENPYGHYKLIDEYDSIEGDEQFYLQLKYKS